ncbi:MAG: hypothetical protein ACREPD_07260 [Stenotrophomonas sp.]|uniref:hypothetical protein n=1 Tax=Stenotrophomonas sp. TaxID=69392 RepID=UPI003D6D618E
MSNILHRPAPDAIGETLDAHSEKPDPPQQARTQHHWSDGIWDSLQPGLYLRARMARLDRSLQAMGTLQQMLMRDHRGVHEQISDPEAYYQHGLTPCEVEGIHLAFDLIWCQAYDDMSDLRDNIQNCWAKGGRA